MGGSGSGVGLRGTSGKGNCWLVDGYGERFLAGSMSGLLASGYQGGYHAEQGLGREKRETAWGSGDRERGQVCGSQGNDALNAGMEPDEANASKALFGGDADEGEGQPVERVGRVSNRNRVDGQCS